MVEMKKRLDTFADAIIAIIVTIMVLELPINVTGGDLDYLTLAKAVGVYAVSFCFVANIWYQHALAFSEVETVGRKTIVWDLVLMLVLSLVPAATRVMTTVENNYSVMLYGVLYLAVTMVLRVIVKQIVHSKYTDHADMAKLYQAIYGNHNVEVGGLIIANIILAYFFPRIAMILFIAVTVRSFFANSGEESELAEAGAMTDLGQKQFINLTPLQKRNFMNTMRRYMMQVQRENGDFVPEGKAWEQFSARIQKQFNVAPVDLAKWMAQRQRQLEKRGYRQQTTVRHNQSQPTSFTPRQNRKS